MTAQHPLFARTHDGVVHVPAQNPRGGGGGGGGRGGGGRAGGGGPRGGGPRGGGMPRGAAQMVARFGAPRMGGARGPMGFRRGGRHRHHHHGHGGGFPIFPWYPYYYYPQAYYWPDYYVYQQPTWYQPETCTPPLSSDCTVLQPTATWATSCFLPRYRYLRSVYGEDYESLASAVAREEAPACPFPARSGAVAEYERRIRLAVAILLNSEGIPVPYPPVPPSPRPPHADSIQQPWMRALLTGWV